MRRGWVLALLAACATERADEPVRPSEATRPAETRPQVPDADLVEELRRYIDEYRPDVYETVFDGPAVAPVDRLQVEWQADDVYEFMAIAAHGETADVVRVESVPWFWHLVHNVAKGQSVDPMECQWVEGAWASGATIPRADFDLLARKVALVERARSRRRPEPKNPFTGGSWGGSFSVRLGDRAPIEHGGFESDLGAPIDDETRALLITWLVREEVSRWSLKEVPDPEPIAPLLLKDLVGTSLPWQRPARIMAFGRLGCGAALPVLEHLEPGTQDVDTALAQIRLLQECRGAKRAPARLMDVAASHGEGLQRWALALLAERFPDGCRAVLYRRFDSLDEEERDRALSDLHALDPSDFTLARRVHNDPDADLRVRGAVMLDDWKLLLALARDPATPSRARIDAIGALTDLRYSDAKGWSEPPGDRHVVGEALIQLMDDPSDEMRTCVVGALDGFGYREAVPALLAALRSALSDPVDEGRATALAAALGSLRAREAIEPLSEALERHASEVLGVRLGLALASIGDPAVLPILERHVGDDLPFPGAYEECVTFLRKLHAHDVPWILEHVLPMWELSDREGFPFAGGPRYVSELLADFLTVEELRARAGNATVKRALALKEGRG